MLGSYEHCAIKVEPAAKVGIMEVETKASEAVAQARAIIQEKLALREIRRRAGISRVPAKPGTSSISPGTRRRPA
jgi:hypothetical protein